MKEQSEKNTLKRKPACSAYRLMLNYRSYIRQRKLTRNQKIVFDYKNIKLGFTEKQITVLRLIANGLSNSRIAHQLNVKESTVKLLIYRLMKYLESSLYENVDRYSLIVIAQKLRLDNPGW